MQKAKSAVCDQKENYETIQDF